MPTLILAPVTFPRSHNIPNTSPGHKAMPPAPPTSMALVSIRVSLNGIFSGNFSLVMATSKQSPKSMWRILPVSLSSIRLEGCLEGEGGGGGGRGRVREGEGEGGGGGGRGREGEG